MQRPLVLAMAAVALTSSVGCQGDSIATGLGSQQIVLSSDTVKGTASLSELQQKRAAWVARGITNYRAQLRIGCFCGSVITRPVLLEVRGGVVTKALDLETGKPVENLTVYPTITALFDAAIAERMRSPNVVVTYDRELGYPVRLTVGTLANDAGVDYTVGGVVPL